EMNITQSATNLILSSYAPKRPATTSAGAIRPIRQIHSIRVLSFAPVLGYRKLYAFARALRRLGCTKYATPILATYSATMGAAKMHMFRISVVGVTIAAIVKIIKSE